MPNCTICQSDKNVISCHVAFLTKELTERCIKEPKCLSCLLRSKEIKVIFTERQRELKCKPFTNTTKEDKETYFYNLKTKFRENYHKKILELILL